MMSTIREGGKVSYIGYPERGLAVGDEGTVLANAGSASHVTWKTGGAAGQVLLVGHEDLVQATARREDDIDLGSAPLVSVAVREVYDDLGEVGLINALAEAGHLSSLSEIAEEALQWVQGKIASDPSIGAVMAHLDPAEQSEMLGFMTAALMRDAFGRDA